MRKLLVGMALLGAVSFAAQSSFAACGSTTPMIHGSAWLNCKDATPVAAFAWQVSSPGTVNSGNEKIACEAQNPDINCLGGTGVAGDGVIDIETDWGNPTIVGCPVVGTTANRVAISVQANDGTGVLLSLSGASPDLGYLVDAAHPVDLNAGVILPLDCASANGRPTVLGVTSSSISLRFNKPRIFSDCDPNSFGFLAPSIGASSTTVCTDSFDGVNSVALGNIYTSAQPCGTRPNVNRATAGLWTLSSVTPQADGTASIPYTKPADGTQCTFVGGTVRIVGVETNSITGFVQIAGSLAPAPQALAVRAAFANGKVAVSFQTDSEVGLAAINVLTDQKGGKGTVKVGSVALQGVGGSGASYNASFGKSEFKSGTTVTIELVTTDGRTTRSQTVAIK